jgi:hypothetical protein
MRLDLICDSRLIKILRKSCSASCIWHDKFKVLLCHGYPNLEISATSTEYVRQCGYLYNLLLNPLQGCVANSVKFYLKLKSVQRILGGVNCFQFHCIYWSVWSVSHILGSTSLWKIFGRTPVSTVHVGYFESGLFNLCCMHWSPLMTRLNYIKQTTFLNSISACLLSTKLNHFCA